MRVEEAVTSLAAQAASRHKRVGVREGVSRHVRTLTRARALRAARLPVECFESFSLGLELVLVPLNQLPCEHGVHGLEGHQVRV
jgi:hypothetical protein